MRDPASAKLKGGARYGKMCRLLCRRLAGKKSIGGQRLCDQCFDRAWEIAADARREEGETT